MMGMVSISGYFGCLGPYIYSRILDFHSHPLLNTRLPNKGVFIPLNPFYSPASFTLPFVNWITLIPSLE